MRNPPPNLQRAYDALLAFAALPDTVHSVGQDNTEAKLTLGRCVVVKLQDEVVAYGHPNRGKPGLLISIEPSFHQDPAQALAFGEIYAAAMHVVKGVNSVLNEK